MAINETRLRQRIEAQARRIKKADRERPNVMSQTVFIGTLGLLLTLPIIAGAYIGLWLDRGSEPYSVRWTLGCILLGVVIGAFNAWYFVKERE
ncbi:MAG: AtpZ/AtpI family protein [Pseudomonadales bacterium]|nr:AtpZ/AtpI family protein [Pseudomonadales bacterium]